METIGFKATLRQLRWEKTKTKITLQGQKAVDEISFTMLEVYTFPFKMQTYKKCDPYFLSEFCFIIL